MEPNIVRKNEFRNDFFTCFYTVTDDGLLEAHGRFDWQCNFFSVKIFRRSHREGGLSL